MKPLIGLPAQRFEHDAWKPLVHGQREAYVQAIVTAGGIPVVMPLIREEPVLKDLYKRLDGIMLCGGGDIHPKLNNRAEDETNYGVDSHRDNAEILIARWALADKKPLLGICRGMQIINVVLGGNLIHDLPTERPTGIDHRACRTNKEMRWLGHGLKLESNSRLAGLLGGTEFKVNSLHHQAIDRLGKGLRAVGRSEDGIIEAIEGDGFVLGVQSHPESLWDGPDGSWQGLFQGLVAAAGTVPAHSRMFSLGTSLDLGRYFRVKSSPL